MGEWVVWLGIILGGVAIVMATPTFLQMFWGRPKVSLGFSVHEGDEVKILFASVSNPPIKKGVLRRLGVRRETIPEVMGYFSVFEEGTNRTVVHGIIAEFQRTADVSFVRDSLPPNIIATRIAIAEWKSGQVTLTEKAKKQILGPGHYRVEIVIATPEQTYQKQRQFIVGHRRAELRWL